MYQLPNESLVSVSVTTENYSQLQSRDKAEITHRVQDQMRMQLADFVARHKTTQVVSEYTTEHRLRLYVVSPDELMALVREEAQKYWMSRRQLASDY